MKILFITDNFYPEINAPAKRTLEHCREWVNLGYQTTVITSTPNFPTGKVFDGYKNRLYQFEIIDNIFVKRVWTYIAPNKGFFFRIIDYASFMVSSFFCGLFTKKHDIVIATSPQFLTLISGYLVSILKRTPLVLEIRDLWPESIVSVGAMKESHIGIKILYKIAIFLYKKAKIIICVTKSFKKDLINKGIDENKIFVIENGFDLEKNILPNKTIEGIEEQYNLNQKDFIVSFIGTIGMAHGLEIVLNAAKTIDRKVKFLIIGDGARKDNLLEITKKENIKNVDFISTISWQEIVNLNQVIDVHLVHLINNPEFKKVIPSKIFESMALKKPIIMGVLGESNDIVAKAKCGINITPENYNELNIVIKKFIDNRFLVKEFGENGYNFLFQNYSRKKLANKMIEYIKTLI